MTLKISPLRPNMMFTDSTGSLTKDAYDFLFAMFQRVGGSLDSLNAATLQGSTWEQPGQIGATTPNYGKFTSLIASGPVLFYGTNQNIQFSPTGTGTITMTSAGVGDMDNIRVGYNNPQYGRFTELRALGAFGCNGTIPQMAYNLPGNATDLTSAIALVNAIRTALINNGIGA